MSSTEAMDQRSTKRQKTSSGRASTPQRNSHESVLTFLREPPLDMQRCEGKSKIAERIAANCVYPYPQRMLTFVTQVTTSGEDKEARFGYLIQIMQRECRIACEQGRCKDGITMADFPCPKITENTQKMLVTTKLEHYTHWILRNWSDYAATIMDWGEANITSWPAIIRNVKQECRKMVAEHKNSMTPNGVIHTLRTQISDLQHSHEESIEKLQNCQADVFELMTELERGNKLKAEYVENLQSQSNTISDLHKKLELGQNELLENIKTLQIKDTKVSDLEKNLDQNNARIIDLESRLNASKNKYEQWHSNLGLTVVDESGPSGPEVHSAFTDWAVQEEPQLWNKFVKDHQAKIQKQKEERERKETLARSLVASREALRKLEEECKQAGVVVDGDIVDKS